MFKQYDPHLNVQEIILIGVGGTGSSLARLIARLLLHLQALGISIPSLTLIDSDVIEAKNIGRQLYSPAEIGMNKAQATALRLACALGLPIRYLPEAFNAKQHVGRQSYGVLLIDAVDNHLARQEIAKLRGVTLLACGNHRSAGQVCLGDSSREQCLSYLEQVTVRESKLGIQASLRHLPHPYVLFPQLLEADEVQAVAPLSCADLVLEGEQDLLINDTMALIAARYVQQILLRQPIESFITFCNLEGALSIKPIGITLDNLRAYLEVSR